MAIPLSKKASNINGIKGTGKVFTIVICRGVKQKVMNHSANASYGYTLSGQTKNKTYTIRNGTY